MSPRAALREGVLAVAPALLGVVPFGLVTGVAAVEVGIAPPEATAMSVVVFAGAAQLAVIDLLGRDAPLAVVVLTGLVINLRLVMYSASLAPYVRAMRGRWRWPVAYLITDINYALAIHRFVEDEETPRQRLAYWMGLALPIYSLWVVATWVGAVVGARVPPGLHLSFAVPLIFLSLLVPSVADRPALVAAVVGGGVAVLAGGLPLNLGLITGALSGILAGLAADRRANR